ncbi:hypothetical protein DDI_1779 [Dickeya dianthicola RNS04.9]|nr:hypothetical protein DDI_1779 [Dickeya dianthicola RNS04.9]
MVSPDSALISQHSIYPAPAQPRRRRDNRKLTEMKHTPPRCPLGLRADKPNWRVKQQIALSLAKRTFL